MPIITHDFFFKESSKMLKSVHEYAKIIERHISRKLKPTNNCVKNDNTECLQYQLSEDLVFISINKIDIIPYYDVEIKEKIEEVTGENTNVTYINIATPYKKYLGYASLYVIAREFLKQQGGVIIDNFGSVYQICDKLDLEYFYNDSLPNSCRYSYKVAKNISPELFMVF